MREALSGKLFCLRAGPALRAEDSLTLANNVCHFTDILVKNDIALAQWFIMMAAHQKNDVENLKKS